MGVVTAEKERELEICRAQKLKVDKNCQRMMWAFIILAAFFYVFALFATADISRNPEYRGPEKWFWGIDAALWQVIFATLTLILGILGSLKHKIPALMLFFLFGGILIWAALGKQLALRAGNMLLAAAGIGLGIFLFMQLVSDDELKQCPGYPLFSVHLEENKEYRPSLIVTGRTASDHMESIEELMQQNPAQQEKADTQEQSSAAGSRDVILPPEVQLSEWTDSSGQQPQPQIPEQARKAAAGIALDGMTEQNVPEKPAETLLSPEGILEEMDLHPAHNDIGDVSMLPDPEEVRAKLAAMKAEKEHAQQQASEASS